MERFKAREIGHALQRKGFHKEESKDHTKYYYYVNGKKTSIHTYMSRGGKKEELSPKLLKKMAIQLKLKYDEFEDLINCPLSKEDYHHHLVSEGFISEE